MSAVKTLIGTRSVAVTWSRIPLITRRLQKARGLGFGIGEAMRWRDGFALRLWDHRVLIVARHRP